MCKPKVALSSVTWVPAAVMGVIAALSFSASSTAFAARGGHQRIEPEKTPMEANAVLTGQFTRERARNRAAAMIRAEGGQCNSITGAEAKDRTHVRIVCNRGEDAYDLVRRGKAWEFTAPSDSRRP